MTRCTLIVTTVFLLLSDGVRTEGAERRFTYVYEATTQPKGQWEYEQWITWKTAKEDNRDYDRFDIRHEFEVGVTDDFQLGFYVSDWRFVDDRDAGVHKGDWRNVAVEGIWNLIDPTTELVGLAIYGEVKIGDELLELEGKLIAQKNFGSFVLAYNAIIEAEWEGAHLDEDNGKLEQTVGLSYQFSPKFLAGMELLHEVDMEDWKGAHGKGRLYVGPNFSYRAKKWWATLTPLFQVSNVDDEPDFQMMLLLGFHL